MLIGATEPRALSETALLALQEALTHQVSRVGRARVIGAGPQRAWLTAVEPALIARWLADLRGLLVAGEQVDASAEAGAKLDVVLDATPFYAESGAHACGA